MLVRNATGFGFHTFMPDLRTRSLTNTVIRSTGIDWSDERLTPRLSLLLSAQSARIQTCSSEPYCIVWS